MRLKGLMFRFLMVFAFGAFTVGASPAMPSSAHESDVTEVHESRAPAIRLRATASRDVQSRARIALPPVEAPASVTGIPTYTPPVDDERTPLPRSGPRAPPFPA